MHVQNLAVSIEPYFEVLYLNISDNLLKIDRLSGSLCLNELKYGSECDRKFEILSFFKNEKIG